MIFLQYVCPHCGQWQNIKCPKPGCLHMIHVKRRLALCLWDGELNGDGRIKCTGCKKALNKQKIRKAARNFLN